MLGAMEIFAICAVIGGLLGLVFVNKTKSKWIGFVLGAIGACITTYLLTQIVFASYLVLPVYAVVGSWLFNVVFNKISAGKNS